MTDHIDATAQRLAHAEQVLDDAKAAEVTAFASIADLDCRAEAIDRRREQIRRDIATEKLTEIQAAGAYGLADADLADVAEIRRTAAEKHSTAVAHTQRAQANVNAAAHELKQEEQRSRFDALAAHTQVLEKALCEALGELFELGCTLHMPRALSSVWRPSAPLRNAIVLQVPPPRSRA